jgi:hypothetical protein
MRRRHAQCEWCMRKNSGPSWRQPVRPRKNLLSQELYWSCLDVQSCDRVKSGPYWPTVFRIDALAADGAWQCTRVRMEIEAVMLIGS